MQRVLLATVLGAALVACDRQEASVGMAASTNTPASSAEGSLVLGTAVDPETEKDILQLDAEENEASGRGDTEGMIDRMLADDTLLINATGRIVTKPQLMAGIRHSFQKNPKEAATAPRPRHDEFWMRRFGDIVLAAGRSTTVNPDKSFGPMRRYMAVFAKRRGQWFVLGRQVIPIDHKRPPDSPEALAVMARAQASPTNTIILGTEPESDLRDQINKLAIAQNAANFIGDREHAMRDRLLADDVLWLTPTGHVQTKAEYLAAVRAAFEKNPNRTANQHDDFTVRRFGDVVIQLGRSTTPNPDMTPGPQRRYMNVFLNRRGQWWLIAHGPTPIVS
jgi:ketosteroid isomerase-like protein